MLYRKRTSSPRTIRFQLLLAVNLTLGLAFTGLLVLRYDREMAEAVTEKQSGLNDEAIAIHAAVSHLSQDHGGNAVQSYIDSVCRKMRESTSPGHHIFVQLKEQLLQAEAHSPAASQLFAEVEAAAARDSQSIGLRVPTLVVGSHAENDVRVFISENLTNVRRGIRREVLVQLAVLGGLGLLAAGIVNVVLLRIVGIPLRQLLATVEQIASGSLGAEAPAFGSHEMHQLSSAINSMSQTLQKNDHERRQQMKKAQLIQQHLLPNGIQIARLETAHIFEPADAVAGDYYDFLLLADGSWLICVADVTGHGVPAAMGASMLKSLLLAAAEHPPFDPVSILDEVNRHFAATVLPGNFASMFLGRWRPELYELTWASAGHEPGILLSDSGRVSSLESTGLLLGIDTDTTWEPREVTLSARDRILLFSDGATETRNQDGELFGRERLMAWFSRCRELSPQAAVTRISGVLGEHRGSDPQSDDLTLVMLQCSPVPLGGAMNVTDDRSVVLSADV